MQQYDSYKDSGVQWLGEIPSHWEVRALKYCCLLKGRIGWNGLKSDEFETNSYAYLVTGQDFKGANIRWSDCYQISQFRYEEDPYIQLKNGDILITKDGTIGKVAKVNGLDKSACLNSGIFVIKQLHSLFSQDYLYWMLVSNVLIEFNRFTQTGATIAHLYQNVFEQMPCVLPPLSEQSVIAAYLDEQTAKIDTAIAQQQKMIDLLNERKQIIINRAVTKGLNPNVKMKDSGVEWIGEVPEGWEVKRVSSLGAFYKGGNISRDDLQESGKPAILYGDIYTKYNIYADEIKNHVSQKVADGSVRIYNGDILMTGSGETKEDIGKTVVFIGEEAYIGGDVILFKQSENNSCFLSYAFNSQYAKDFRYRESKGEIVVHIYASSIRQLYLALPNIDEQKAIVEFLDKNVKIIDSEINVVKKQIALLQERKQIIINEVVTGKVKVG